jgi:oxaloacetate decarboxylase alpha subunit/pyruvate carboxylase subunit B
MLSNFRNQLKEQGMSDKFEQVMLEIPYVRKCLGYIPLVTPTSQIVGTQAMLNVKFGRWANIAQSISDIALGKFGRTPGPIDPEFLKLVLEKTGQKPIYHRPADSLTPRMPKLREELSGKGLPTDDEACVLFAMFPVEFAKLHQKPAPTPTAAPAISFAAPTGPTARYALTINGHRSEVSVAEVA